MLHLDMATITVRVRPRSGRTAVESGPAGVVVPGPAAPEGGRATEEAARALAERLGVPKTRISLRSGVRSRTKTFEVEGSRPATSSSASAGHDVPRGGPSGFDQSPVLPSLDHGRDQAHEERDS